MSEPSGLTLRPPRQMKLPEAVAQQLLTEIRSRGLAPGTKLPSEKELMERLSVGRSTVREALRGLALLGVVDVRHGQGNFVAALPPTTGTAQGLAAILSNGTMLDLLEARRLVEVQIARLAADRRTDEDLRDMQSVLDRDASTFQPDNPARMHTPSFHLALCRATHNAVLEGFVETYRNVLAQRSPSLVAIPGYPEWEFTDHARLLNAVRDRDVERAGRIMQDHLILAEELSAMVSKGQIPPSWPPPPG